MENKLKSFRELDVYKKAFAPAMDIYEISKTFPKEERYSLTDQNNFNMAELLLFKGYQVHGIIRRASFFNTKRMDHLYNDPHKNNIFLLLHYGDLAYPNNLNRLMRRIQPKEIYNLEAQSDVNVSFEVSEYNADVNGISRRSKNP